MEIQSVHLPDQPDLAARVRDLTEEAARVDGIYPFSEQFLLGLVDARVAHRHLILTDGDQLRGVAACDDSSCELVVAPDARRQGVGTALLEAVGDADVWAHGDLPAARALAEASGRRPTRRLLVMSVADQALTEAAVFEPRPGFEALSLRESAARWGRDTVEQAWLDANNEAFSWHPEQGGWDLDRLRRAQEAAWFDEDDVLFHWDTSTDGKPALAGFHWTKWHTEDTPAFGEVYVVGLATAYRGQGLGDPLLRLGLEHLAGKGARRVILYVEADNGPAVRVYEDLGFVVDEEHVVYSQP